MTVIADVEDGENFLSHPRLGRQSGDLGMTKVAITLYYDDIEVANPLGFAAGKHALGCIYIVINNLDPSIRTAMPYIQVATLATVTNIKRYGMLRIISGADDAGAPIPSGHESSIGAQLRRFDIGVKIQVPDLPMKPFESVDASVCRPSSRRTGLR